MTLAGLWLACAPPAQAPGEPTPPLTPVAPPTARLDTYAEMWADQQAPRAPSDGQGQARWRRPPGEVHAGEVVELALDVVSAGVAPGGSLHVLPEPFWGWSEPQTERPDAPGYVTVEAPVPVRLETWGGQLRVVFPEGLPPETRVGVTYRGRADRFAEAASTFSVGIDGDGDGVRALLADTLSLRVLPGPAARLWLTLPTTAPPGRPARLTLAALDAVGNRAVHADPVELVLPSGWTGPDQVRLVDGVARVEVVPTASLGVVTASSGALVGVSNPLVARDDAPRILWADLQIHTGASDGTGRPDEVLAYAREVAGLDVAAVTDHDHWGMRFLDATPALWEASIQAAHDAGRADFLALPAYEWTSWVWGHRHVLFFDRPGPLASSMDPAYDTPAELWAAFRGRDVVIVPHHPAGGPVALDWASGTDPELEPVVEVVSVHGQSDAPGLPSPIRHGVAWIEPELRAGRRLGLIGSTDGHDGHPGLAHLIAPTGGLTALVDAEPTPAGVLAALRARRVYATSGPRMLLRLEANGSPMGSVLPPGPTAVELRVLGTTELLGVELVFANRTERLPGAGGAALRHAFTFDAEEGDLIYARVVQADGGMGWTSPIFFTASSADSPATAPGDRSPAPTPAEAGPRR